MNSGRKRIRRSATPGRGHQPSNNEFGNKPDFNSNETNRFNQTDKSSIDKSGDRDFRKFDRDHDRPFNRDRAPRPFNREGGDRPFNRERSDRPFNREGGDRPFNRERSDRPFNREGGDRPFNRERSDRPFNREGGDRPFNRERSDRPFNREGGDRPFNRDRPDRPFNREGGDRPFNRERSDRPFNREGSDRPFNRERSDRPFNREGGDRPFNRDRSDRPFNREGGDRPFRKSFGDRRPLSPEQEEMRQAKRREKREQYFNPFDTRGVSDDPRGRDHQEFGKSRFDKGDHQLMRFEMKGPAPKEVAFQPKDEWPIRLNRYLANAGIASRRDCDRFIQDGRVKVNGELITELGTKVNQSDVVLYDDEPISREKLVYVLLNKPKNFITTTEDPEGRKTVMDLVSKASAERLFPVGRLDRNTTGLLLLTNDGSLAQKLMHPSFEAEKVYHVILDQPLTKNHLIEISEGLELEDGKVEVDEIAYVKPEDKREIGVEIHTGKNRIVRRIFEKMGYVVEKLDRVVYAGLTKLDLPRGHWRYLTAEELRRLKKITK